MVEKSAERAVTIQGGISSTILHIIRVRWDFQLRVIHFIDANDVCATMSLGAIALALSLSPYSYILIQDMGAYTQSLYSDKNNSHSNDSVLLTFNQKQRKKAMVYS